MLEVTPLLMDDLPAALHLSTQAGWNQLSADWERLLRLYPESCLAGRLNGQVVATATLAVYPSAGSTRPAVGWVGMVLVEAGHRGRGFGGTMMSSILQIAERLGVPVVGLDATDQGRPVYLKQGFVDASGIDRWRGPTRVRGLRRPDNVRDLTRDDWPALLAMDASATGVDRSALLRRLASEAGATVRVIEHGGTLRGYVFRRAGRADEYIGPMVAESPGDARALVESLLADGSAPGHEQTLIDLPRGTPLGEAMASFGFAVTRRLTRMTRPCADRPILSSEHVFAAAAFELG